MKKIIITGFSGFVARHYIDYLYQLNDTFQLLGIDINEPKFDFGVYKDRLSISFQKVNMLDREALQHAIIGFQPDYILHLASFSSVAHSWKFPDVCFDNNTKIFLNLMESVRLLDDYCRVLSIGSSEEYGNVSDNDIPLTENAPLMPISPYAAARVSQEIMSRIYTEGFGMDIIMTRSFNHIGPYQDLRFAIPSFIKRIMEVKQTGVSEGMIETGDVGVVRDFVDVRDVVRAYHLLLTNGTKGSIYNVCSGSGVKLYEIIDIISDIMGIKIHCSTNQAYIRPNDNKIIVGSYAKISKELGWAPKIPMSRTLEDMIKCMGQGNGTVVC